MSGISTEVEEHPANSRAGVFVSPVSSNVEIMLTE